MAYNTPLQPHSHPHPLSRGELYRRSQFFNKCVNTPLQPHSQPLSLSRGELVKYAFILLFIAFLPSCKPDAIKGDNTFFDIKGYFHADSLRLTRLNHPILKTVTHNGVSETKTVHINNWGLELSSFIESDINKSAWKDSYAILNTGNTIIYKAKDPELKTRRIVIDKENNKIKWILIFNDSKNMLYRSQEKLSYFPDSIYIIQKYQKVRLLKANTYTIKGSLN